MADGNRTNSTLSSTGKKSLLLSLSFPRRRESRKTFLLQYIIGSSVFPACAGTEDDTVGVACLPQINASTKPKPLQNKGKALLSEDDSQGAGMREVGKKNDH
jgi:hypothetical protein